jgi:ABC-type multidrug transport system fused ATPase/permease subunit
VVADKAPASHSDGQPLNETGDEAATSLRRLLAPLIAPNRSRLITLAAVSLVGGFSEALVLVIVARVGVALSAGKSSISVDLGFVGGLNGRIATWLAAAAGLVVVKFLLQAWSARLSAVMLVGELARARRRLFQLFLDASWGLQSKEREGQLQEVMTTYAGNTASVLGSLTQGITALTGLVALLAAAFAVNVLAAFAVLAAILVLLGALRPFRNGVRRRSGVAAAAQLQFATALTETTLMTQEIRIFNAGGAVRARMDDAVEKHARAALSSRFLGGLLPNFYQTSALVLVIAALFIADALKPDDLASLGAVLLVVVRALSQGQLLQSVYQYLHESAPYVETLDREASRYRAAGLVEGGQPVARIDSLAFEHVWFEYDRGVPVLRDVSFRAARGDIIGIVGPSGSGKSTLVQILLRLRDPVSGRVLADGRPTTDLLLKDWYDRVTFVPQEPRLFSASVAENIRFFRDDVDEAEIERAARAAHLHDEISAWPAGYATPVGERGGELSGGQRQRLCIGRALVGDPDVIVMDEPTSSMDAKSESLIRETLSELGSRETVFVIAHRLSTLDVCSQILVLVNGEVQGFDEPARLEEDSTFYREALRLSGIR